MDDLVRWLGEQLDIDAEAARAANVRDSDPAWWGSPVLADGDAYTVRSERDNAPTARVRRLYDDDGHTVVLDGRAVAEHIAEWDPARVLREIDAKRRIVDRYAWLREHGDTGGTAWVLPLLALPYADRPGYREDWRP